MSTDSTLVKYFKGRIFGRPIQDVARQHFLLAKKLLFRRIQNTIAEAWYFFYLTATTENIICWIIIGMILLLAGGRHREAETCLVSRSAWSTMLYLFNHSIIHFLCCYFSIRTLICILITFSTPSWHTTCSTNCICNSKGHIARKLTWN